MRYIFEPGFFTSGPVHIALAVGTVIAITSAVTGVFTVTRGQSFAGHSLADISTTGGSGAFLIGINQFWGYLAFGAGAAAFMEMIGIQRRRGRDVATGVVLGAALGLAALFLYLGTQYSSTTGASFTILFGSMFVLTSSTVPALIVSALLALATVLALARVLLLSSLSPDIAGRPRRAGAGRRRGLPDGAGGVGGAVRGDHRLGAEHRAADRPGRDRAAGRQGPGPGHGRGRGHRRGRHLDRHRARVRQLLLAARAPRLAGQLLRGHADRRRLPDQLLPPPAGARPGPPARPRHPGP